MTRSSVGGRLLLIHAFPEGMTPYVSAMILELSHDLPVMSESLQSESFREAVMFRCSEILSLAPALDLEPAKEAINRLREIYPW